ncbi:beta/gamma crystallin domain-containing protein [Streptomyces sp. NPDC051639]|uniref:beta/gamma crystallin domain-containing protein n=1 Tax=Streptomyces sp. NPDC051639 TaxID=3155671 RepID=UPI003432BB08
MKNRLTAVLVTTLTMLGLTILVPTESASAATASANISEVPCDSSDYLQVWYHIAGFLPKTQEVCYATAGTFEYDSNYWLDAFSTGNNVVQYKSDGTWQPASLVGKYTYMQFPNHPGGVKWEGIYIR